MDKTFLRDIIHIIADAPTPTDCVPTLLNMAEYISGAQSSAFILFDDSFQVLSHFEPTQIPENGVLRSIVEPLTPGVHTNLNINGTSTGKGHYALMPIIVQNQTVGVIWLTSPDSLIVDAEAFEALGDAFTIIARERLTLAHQERLNRNQSEFIRIVSHDLRTPLTAMQGFAAMLEGGLAGEINEKQQHFVERILAGITTMTVLVENIQDAGRYDPETGFYVMQRTACDVEELIQRSITNHLLPAEKQELSIHAEYESLPVIHADKTMLERAITNLVDNAIKYTPNGGQVTVGARRNGDEIVVYVRDTGYGISQENQKRLFERHFRIPKAEHKRVKGSGLGLFIVRSVAQRHGGRAWVESIEGEGSTFCFSIPIQGVPV